jgi:cytoskeletal protein RodZ
MSSVGETLRRERLRKELGLAQISRETKIPARLLEAIEKDRFELLPGGVFAKSFVRQYARYLGLDEEELAAAVDKAVHPVGDLSSFASSPTEPTFKVPRMSDWDGGHSDSSILPALARVVAVMLVCSAVYAWWQRSRRPAPVTPPIAAVQKAAAPASKPAAPAPSAAAAPAQEATPAPGQTDNALANPAATVRVSLTADADDWLRVASDGKVVMTDVLHPSEVKTFAAVDAMRIRIGDAGSLQMTINGKPAGPLGPKGQVRTVEITRDGLHILPPPPKPAPAPAPELAPEPL